MPAIYKFMVVFEALDYDDFTDDEFWEECNVKLSLKADSQEEAEIVGLGELNAEYSAVRDVTFVLKETIECPPGKFLLERNMASRCGRFLSDGMIMLERELAFVDNEMERREFDDPFPGWKAGEPLGKYTVIDRGKAVFREGVISHKYIKELNAIGVLVYSVPDHRYPEPFALAKNGRYVGVAMPMHTWNERLDTPEDRQEFINQQEKVFDQQDMVTDGNK